MDVDEIDIEIVKRLERNARGSFKEIAEELDISEGTVYNRVNRMEEEGVIKGYSVRTDAMKLGKDLEAIIEIKVDGDHLIEVEEEVASKDPVRCVYDVTGNYDAVVIARFESRKSLNDFVKNIISMEYVEGSTTHLVLNVVKEDFRTF